MERGTGDIVFTRVEDPSDAYENRAYLPDPDAAIAAWETAAAAFRDGLGARATPDVSYGGDARQRLDLFRPGGGAAEGLVCFYHGGYWRGLDARLFSHFAAGALARGWAVAMPAYRLCPAVGVPDIVRDAALALAAAAEAVPDGPVVLAGHSAGGHLACRMACADVPLAAPLARRIGHVVSISGLHDLRPLLETDKNADLRLDAETAAAESPALRLPRPGVRLTAWVGADERPEFVRQSALIANVWTGLGAATRSVVEEGRHHFDVIDSLAEPDGRLTEAMLAPMGVER